MLHKTSITSIKKPPFGYNQFKPIATANMQKDKAPAKPARVTYDAPTKTPSVEDNLPSPVEEPVYSSTVRVEESKEEPVADDSPTGDIIENWTGANLETLSQWIQISSLQIEILDLAIKHFRSIVRKNVLLGLVFSTASGSISISQLNSAYQTVVLNVIFTIMSFSIAIFTGLIKIYQIQERLEEFIQLKQEWIGFSVVITTEVQLPVGQRKLAIDLITKNKNKYLDLLKRDVDIPNFIKGKAYKNLYHDRHKQAYLKNCERHKLLKEIWSCVDENYFLKLYDKIDQDNILQYDDHTVSITWANCICVVSGKCVDSLVEMYKYCMNHKDKYIGEKTALSNIILTVIMEEENYQRSKQIVELMNLIQERYNKISLHKNTPIRRQPSFPTNDRFYQNNSDGSSQEEV